VNGENRGANGAIVDWYFCGVIRNGGGRESNAVTPRPGWSVGFSGKRFGLTEDTLGIIHEFLSNREYAWRMPPAQGSGIRRGARLTSNSKDKMRMRIGILCWALAMLPFASAQSQSRPLVDHHQHFFSPTVTKLSPGLEAIQASDLIALLDSAGFRRALVLSVAYQFGNPNKPPIADEYAQVKAENDWTSRQVARFPDRLRGFCSVNPMKDYAIEELARCAKDPQLHIGLKLHFGNSDVDLDNPQHVEQLRRVFRVANEHRMAIVVHMRPSVTQRRPYGARQARIFLSEALPAAPDVPIQIAHLAGAGGYDDPSVDQALAVFADAIAKQDTRMAHVYFDVSGVAGYGRSADKVSLITARIRHLGIDRILYGSDGAGQGNLAPREAWAAFLQLSLSDDEFRTIANNIAPYMQ
jgi:predicted TIM-barrel fold metal-dependent hydrolase